MTRSRFQGEGGASLVMAMAFLVLFGATSVTLLVLTGTSLRVTKVTRAEVTQLYAADGGIENGVRTLQTDQVDGTTNTCPAVSGSYAGVSTPTINGRVVTVTCKTIVGGTSTTTITDDGMGSALRTGYSLLLGTSGLTFTGNYQNGAPSTRILGDVYSGGSLSVPDPDVAITVQGDLEYYAACPPPPTNVTVASPGVCSRRTTAPAVTAPTVVIPTATAPLPATYGSNCTVLYPGKYTAANLGAFSDGAQYYMASGTYYITDAGDLNMKGTVYGGAPFAGTPGAETRKVTGPGPCATDAIADSLSSTYVASTAGSGVSLLLGGNTVIRPQSNSTVELYSRVPNAGSADASATPGVSIWARTAAQTNYTPSTDATVVRTESKASTFVIHGLTYLPEKVPFIREPLNTGAGGTSLFMGGLVARGLILNPEGNSPAGGVSAVGGATSSTSTQTSTSTRTILVCSSAAGSAATGPMLIQASVILDPTTPQIKTWRKVTAC